LIQAVSFCCGWRLRASQSLLLLQLRTSEMNPSVFFSPLPPRLMQTKLMKAAHKGTKASALLAEEIVNCGSRRDLPRV